MNIKNIFVPWWRRKTVKIAGKHSGWTLNGHSGTVVSTTVPRFGHGGFGKGPFGG